LLDPPNDGQQPDQDSDSEVTADGTAFQVLSFWQMQNSLYYSINVAKKINNNMSLENVEHFSGNSDIV